MILNCTKYRIRKDPFLQFYATKEARFYGRNWDQGYIYILDKAPQIVQQVLDREGWIEFDPEIHKEDEWNLWWRGYRPKPSEYKQGKPYQKFNHFPKLNFVGTKDNLSRMMK